MKNRSEVAQKMDYEGSEYFVTGYASADQMPDDEVKAVFEKAEKAYSDFLEVVEELEVLVGIS